MPDAAGNLKGSGWSREREAGWERVFGETTILTTPDIKRRYDEMVERNFRPVPDPAPEGAGSDDDWTCDGCGTDCGCCCRC